MTGVPNVRIARVWDSCVIADYLAGKPRAEPHARPIVEAAKRGEIQIWASLFTQVEVAYLEGIPNDEAEKTIEAFLDEDYIITIMLDVEVAKLARRLVRATKVKGKDAVHVASAIRWSVKVFETFDGKLIDQLKGIADNPEWGGLIVREPLFDGQTTMI